MSAGTAFLLTWVAIVVWGISTKRSAIISIGGGFIAACVAAIIVGPSKPVGATAWQSEDESTMAYIAMEDFVKRRLKAPSTAEFPGVFDGRTEHVKSLGDQRYIISSYVDAQNAFGGMMRNSFRGEVQQTSPDRWQLNSLTLSERSGEETKPQVQISQSEYGDRWPYTVPNGILECQYNDVTLTYEGVTYAINGSARDTGKYRDLKEIWRDNPEFPGAKMPDAGIIERGLALCSN